MNATQRFTGSSLAEAINNIDHGLLWLDRDLCIEGHNAACRGLLDIPGESDFLGRPYGELMAYLHERGEFFGEEHENCPAWQLHEKARIEPLRIERVRPNGIALSVLVSPLPSGGYVFAYQDITQERKAQVMQRRNTKATVVALANFAEHRDTDTGVHVLRVARQVGQTARKLMLTGKYPDIDEAFIEHASTASILHDVGKIATPDRILLKPGGLTHEEREVMKKHATDGANLLKQAKLTLGHSAYLELGREIALTHHEWYDGRGYPRGLAGDAIPLAGRICAVADVFDALTSRRPYKTPWETAKAIELIQNQRGTQFDPDVVDAFLEGIAERERVCLVQWDDRFSVGNLHIDEQHTVLIDTINQLASAESLHNHHCVLMIIDELASYATFHFGYEECLMERADYPQLEEHRIIHDAFVRWVTDLRDEYLNFGRRPLGTSVLNYLRDWLSHHILGEDQRYRSFIQGLV